MRTIDLWTALRYPYAFGNLYRGWLVPAIVLVVAQIVTALLMQFVPEAARHFEFIGKKPPIPVFNGFLIVLTVQFVLFITMNMLLCGFLWTMTATLQTHGKSAPLPRWRDTWKGYWWRGFKLFIVVSLFAMAMAYLTQRVEKQFNEIPMLVMALLTVIYTVSGFGLLVLIVESSTAYRFIDLLRFYRPFACFQDYFIPWMIACMDTVLLLGLYSLVWGLVSIMYNAVLGDYSRVFDLLILPFGVVPIIVSIWHLFNQPFLPEPEPESE